MFANGIFAQWQYLPTQWQYRPSGNICPMAIFAHGKICPWQYLSFGNIRLLAISANLIDLSICNICTGKSACWQLLTYTWQYLPFGLLLSCQLEAIFD